MEIVVFGAGSLGSLVGGLLARAHDVTLVGRDPHMSAIRESGLRVEGCVEFVVHPDARTDAPESADPALVTVKAFDTPAAATALADCDLDTAISLQNGLGNEATLAAELDAVDVLAGTCTYGAHTTEPGHVTATGLGEIAFGPPDGGASAAADRAAEAFRAAGIETTVAPDMPRRQWTKLAVNAGINPTTGLAQVENSALREGPGREVAIAAARETARVAREQAIDLGDEEAVAALDGVIETTAGNTSSMLADLRAGRRTEIDAINGAVVASAGESTPVPVNRTLAGLVRAFGSPDR